MKMKQILKRTLWTIGIVLFVLVVLVLALPLWIGPVGTCISNKVAPNYVTTSFALNHLALNPYKGHAEVGQLVIGNTPSGSKICLCDKAVDLNLVSVDLEMMSLFTDIIHVKDVTLDGLTVAATFDGSNFDEIIKKEEVPEETAPAEETPAPVVAENAPAPAATEEQPTSNAEKPAKRVIIDRILLKNITVCYGPIHFPIPEIEMKDIGQEKQGATLIEVIDKLIAAVMQSMSDTGTLLQNAGAASVETLTSSVSNLTDSVSASLDSAAQSLFKSLTPEEKTPEEKAADEKKRAERREKLNRQLDKVSDSAGKLLDLFKSERK